MKTNTRIFVPVSWLIVVIEAIAFFGYHYRPAGAGVVTSIACALFITLAEWRWSRNR